MSDWMKQQVQRVAGSDAFLSMFSEGFVNDPKCALELGAAILLNKPIVFIVKTGMVVPDRLKLIADAIEYYKGPDDLAEATKKVLHKLAALEIKKKKNGG